MRNRLAIIAILALLAVPARAQENAAPEQGNPPATLVQRNGFWTANNAPPDTEGFEVHVVQRGDTLWALAGQYLGNPFLWPQLWEANEHIVNPHWIYPEDQILIRPVTQITEVVPPPPPEPVAPEPEPVEEQAEPPRPVQLPNLTPDLGPPVATVTSGFDLPPSSSASEIKAKDLYCSGFIRSAPVSRDLRVAAKATGASNEGFYAVLGDYVYLTEGSAAGISPGDLFTAVRPTLEIDSPRKGVGPLGRHYLEIGQLEAVTVQPEFTMARVVHSCDAVSIGDALIPFNRIDIPELPLNRPLDRFMPASGNVTGAVANAQSVLLLIEPALGASTALAGLTTGSATLTSLRSGMSGEGEIVYIDLGSRDGVASGDLFLIYRPQHVESRIAGLDRATQEAIEAQREVFGELVVLKVEERASTALITFASDGVARGDLIEKR